MNGGGEDEVIRMAHDKRRTGTGLPRHESGRRRDAEVLSGGGQRRRGSMLNTSGKKNGQVAGRRATLFGINEVFDGERSIESEIWGVFPRGFIDFALGLGYRIRAFTIYERLQAELL